MRKTVPLTNEQRFMLKPLLTCLSKLREAYEQLPRGDPSSCDERLRDVRAALRDPRIRKAIDPLLAGQQAASRTTPLSAAAIEREVLLGSYFGFSEKKVKTYIAAVDSSARSLTFTSVADLEAFIVTHHEDTKARLREAQQSRYFGRRGRMKHAQTAAEHGIYRVGAIIADGLHRELFSASYALATAAPLARR
jgi:hypothetical protein